MAPTNAAGTQGRKPWSVEDVKEILAGVAPPDRVRESDRKGLSPVGYAALQAAATADSLMPLLSLLDPPTEEEVSSIDVILQLLERLAEGQIRIEARLAGIESRLAGQRAASPRPPAAITRADSSP